MILNNNGWAESFDLFHILCVFMKAEWGLNVADGDFKNCSNVKTAYAQSSANRQIDIDSHRLVILMSLYFSFKKKNLGENLLRNKIYYRPPDTCIWITTHTHVYWQIHYMYMDLSGALFDPCEFGELIKNEIVQIHQFIYTL